MGKKIYPRISSRLPVVVTNEEGVQLKVTAIDTSNEVFSIQCSTLQRNIVTPGGSYLKNGRPVELDAMLDLPVSENQVYPLKARCHVTFSRRVASDRCEIGMRFVDFDGEGYQKLVRFIETRMTSSFATAKAS